MPSIKDAVQQNQVRRAMGGSALVMPEAPAPSAPPVSPLDVPVLMPQRGMFPANLVLASDRSDSSREFRGAGARSATFPYPPAQTPTAKVIQQVAAVSPAAAAILLQTNSVNNPNQEVLNLLAGAGMTLTPNGSGGVTLVSTAAGDGLIHGNSIWEIDSAYFVMREDFYPGSGVAQSSSIVASPSITDSGWILTPTGGTGYSETNFLMGAPPNLGQLYWNNVATANRCATLSPVGAGSLGGSGNTNVTAFWPILDYPSWSASFVFKFDQFAGTSPTAFATTSTSFYIGFSGDNATQNAANTVSRPRCFAGLRFDTDTTAPSLGDSFFVLEVVNNTLKSSTYARDNTQGSTLVTNVAPAAGVWHRLDITCTVAGTMTLTLDGSSANTLVAAMPKTVVTNSGSVMNASSVNNQAHITWTPLSTQLPGPNWGYGSKITVANIATANYTFLNGNWVVSVANVNTTSALDFLTTASIGASSISAATTITGYPALIPFVTFGNDSNGSTAKAKSIFVDYFGFAWNPGVDGGTGVPNSVLARYW